MKAVVITRFGGPEVLEIRNIDRPTPGPGQVVVRVVASAVNPVEAKLRADGSWAGLELPVVLGYDGAGVVEEVGCGVSDWRSGDEVYFTPEIAGNRFGTHCEYTLAPGAILARKPRTLSFEQAAAVPLAGGTAWEAIVSRLAVRPSETVLIHGGAGGVGSFAVQIARACGARVLATASAAHQHLLKELGCDVAIDYTRDDVAEVALQESDGGVDAVFSTVGGDTVGRSIRAVRPFGRIAYILPPAGDLSDSYRKNVTLHGIMLTRERRRLEQLGRLIDSGRLCPLVTQTLALESVAEAHLRLDSGHGAGKMVLRVAER